MVNISKKHGLNPSINTCFWCGSDKEIILFGELKNDTEAPMHITLNYEPCDTCKENMKLGITLIEASTSPVYEGQPEIQKGVYPTSRWVVVIEDVVKRIFDISTEVINKRKAFLDITTFQILFKDI